MIRVTRRADDWVLVIAALQTVDEDALVESIRSLVRTSNPSTLLTLSFEERDEEAIRVAVRAADLGRPSYFPPVLLEEVS